LFLTCPCNRTAKEPVVIVKNLTGKWWYTTNYSRMLSLLFFAPIKKGSTYNKKRSPDF
jgi:hypothetical protein